jgi:hypothetical protein
LCRTIRGAGDPRGLSRGPCGADARGPGHALSASEAGLPSRLSSDLAAARGGDDRHALWDNGSIGHHRLLGQAAPASRTATGARRATRYDAIVVARLCGGTTPLTSALRPLVQAAERTRALDEAKRRQPVWRLDAGGGSVADVTWLLEHNSHVPCKAYAGTRAQTVAASVTAGGDDPRIPERPGGWVTVAPTASNRPVRRVAGRCRKKNGPWGVGGVSATLAPAEVRALARQPVDRLHAPSAVLLA